MLHLAALQTGNSHIHDPVNIMGAFTSFGLSQKDGSDAGSDPDATPAGSATGTPRTPRDGQGQSPHGACQMCGMQYAQRWSSSWADQYRLRAI